MKQGAKPPWDWLLGFLPGRILGPAFARQFLSQCIVTGEFWGAMLTLVLRREHVNRRTSMATAEYRRGHGTLKNRFD